MPRYTRHSPRLSKVSKKSPQRSPSPSEEVIQRKLKSKRQRKERTATKPSNSLVHTDEDEARDLIDTISSTHEAEHVAEKDGGTLLEVTDEGLDKSDNESTASGPSLQRHSPPKKRRAPKDMCSACRKLYLKAKRMKAPMKNKLLDNDPKSLTCDQWVLNKTWTPRRLPSARGKLLSHLQLVKKRLQVKSDADSVEQFSACSRQHTLLHRNLRRCVRVPAKKGSSKNRRKRTRDESRSPRIAKQQRLHKDNCHQDISIADTDNVVPHPSSCDGNSSGYDVSAEQETNDPEDTYMTLELIPTSVRLEITKPKAAPHKQTTQKRTGGFRNLLAQIRGNSSMIVKETS